MGRIYQEKQAVAQFVAMPRTPGSPAITGQMYFASSTHWRHLAQAPHRLFQRQADKEGAPSTRLTFSPDAPPMPFDDLCTDIETQPQTCSASWSIAVLARSIETLKKMRQVFLADALPLILHAQQHFPCLTIAELHAQRHHHLAGCLTVLERIAQQVVDDLLQARFIPYTDDRLQRTDQSDALITPQFVLHDDLAHELDEIDGVCGHVKQIGLQLGALQQVAQQPRDVLPLLLNDLQIADQPFLESLIALRCLLLW